MLQLDANEAELSLHLSTQELRALDLRTIEIEDIFEVDPTLRKLAYAANSALFGIRLALEPEIELTDEEVAAFLEGRW